MPGLYLRRKNFDVLSFVLSQYCCCNTVGLFREIKVSLKTASSSAVKTSRDEIK